MRVDSFEWLQDWYKDQCDGEWEHSRGVRIDTLDNPGWSMVIDLAGTELEAKKFQTFQTEEPSGEWLHCRVRDGRFEAACSPTRLTAAVRVFREWYEAVHS